MRLRGEGPIPPFDDAAYQARVCSRLHPGGRARL